MTVCIRRNVCNNITLDYMKNTNILIHERERVNIPVFHIMASKFMYISRCRCVCVCVLVAVLTYMLISI